MFTNHTDFSALPAHHQYQNVEAKRSKPTNETGEPGMIKPVKSNCLNGLPPEVKVLICEHLTHEDRSNLSMASRSFRDVIVNHFLLNKTRLTRTFDEIRETHETSPKGVHYFSVLVKRATFAYSPGQRIRLFIQMFETVLLRDRLRQFYEQTDKTAFEACVRTIRCLFAMLIRGWEFSKVLRLIDELEIYFDFCQMINQFLRHECGAIREDEQFVRQFYLKIIIEGLVENRHRAKWLIHFLDTHTKTPSDPYIKMTYKGKLLLLIFAPIVQDDSAGVVYVDWLAFSSSIFIDGSLNNLGLAFKLLNVVRTQAGLDIAHLFLTVTNIARYWLYENSALLLLCCGANVAKQIVDLLLSREDYLHLVRYLVHLFIVEGNLVMLDKIAPSQRITEPIYEHLKRSMNVLALDNIFEMIAYEFLRVAQETEQANGEREYLGAYKIVLGQKQFYQLVMRKRNSVLETDISTIANFYEDLI